MIEELKTYLKVGFGGLGHTRRVKLPSSFPLVISGGYEFYRSEVMGQSCVLALAVEGRGYTPRMVKVQLDRVTKEFGLPVVFVTKVLHAHDKERYLAARQALVVPGRFAYLPFAGLKQDDRQTEFAVTRETFSPIAQLIVLGFLEHCFNLPLTIKGVAQMLQVSEPSVQQAMKEIEFFGLAERKRKNGTKSFEFEFRFCGRELWDRSQSLLSSPVKKTVGLLSLTSVGGDDCTVAGVDALAGISMLNEQDPSVFAFPLTGFGKRGLKLVSTVGAPIKAQLWAYDPKKLGKTSIDVLSLILSLRGETDDRVQIETDRILEEFKW